MKYPIYVVHDALVGYQNPSIMHNDAFAMRNFSEAFDGVKNSSDYSLWKVGYFDTETGLIESMSPSLICRASDFIKESE